jgi:transcription elongation factor Elf1
MPLTGEIAPGSSFFCPHCGALYAVTFSRRRETDSGTAKCVVCERTMTEWKSTRFQLTSSFIDLKMPRHKREHTGPPINARVTLEESDRHAQKCIDGSRPQFAEMCNDNEAADRLYRGGKPWNGLAAKHQ